MLPPALVPLPPRRLGLITAIAFVAALVPYAIFVRLHTEASDLRAEASAVSPCACMVAPPPPPASPLAPAADGPLVVVARLVDASDVARLPGCGLADVWTTLPYDVVTVESGRLDARRIWVDQECPSDRPELFRGGLYRMRLTPRGDHPVFHAAPLGAVLFEAAETEALGAPR